MQPNARRELREALTQLEVPDCACKLLPQLACAARDDRCHDAPDCGCPAVPPKPCRHVLSRNHGLSIEAWAAALLEAWPRRYREPPPPEQAAVAIDSDARVALMILRRRVQKVGLRHPDDIYDLDRLAVLVELTRNNRPRYGGIEIEDCE